MVGDHGLAFGMDEGSAVVALVRCWVGTAETGPSREIMAANLLTSRCELSDGAGSVRCVLRKPQCRPMAASVSERSALGEESSFSAECVLSQRLHPLCPQRRVCAFDGCNVGG